MTFAQITQAMLQAWKQLRRGREYREETAGEELKPRDLVEVGEDGYLYCAKGPRSVHGMVLGPAPERKTRWNRAGNSPDGPNGA